MEKLDYWNKSSSTHFLFVKILKSSVQMIVNNLIVQCDWLKVFQSDFHWPIYIFCVLNLLNIRPFSNHRLNSSLSHGGAVIGSVLTNRAHGFCTVNEGCISVSQKFINIRLFHSNNFTHCFITAYLL